MSLQVRTTDAGPELHADGVGVVCQDLDAVNRCVVEDHTRAMPHEELDRLFTRRDVGLRDRALWRLLYESGARANEVLNLNVEDVDLDAKRAYTVRKGGDRDVSPARAATWLPACSPCWPPASRVSPSSATSRP